MGSIAIDQTGLYVGDVLQLGGLSNVRQVPAQIPQGDARHWRVFVPGVDPNAQSLSAQWLLGTPQGAEYVQLLGSTAPPATLVSKSSDSGTLSISSDASGSGVYLTFDVTAADTQVLAPGFYLTQAVLSLSGAPVTVAEGLVYITASLPRGTGPTPMPTPGGGLLLALDLSQSLSV